MKDFNKRFIDVLRVAPYNLGAALVRIYKFIYKISDPFDRKLLQEAANYILDELSAVSGNTESSPFERPEIVCLCGSTKYKKHFLEINKKLTLSGYIVLSPAAYTHTDDGGHAEEVYGVDVKKNLDRLHLRKIDLADKVFIVDVDGYTGPSTRGEIDYSILTNKPVFRYSEYIQNDDNLEQMKFNRMYLRR